jgi:hypothetical protein
MALPHVGYLNNLNPVMPAPSTDAFLQGMRDAGWTRNPRRGKRPAPPKRRWSTASWAFS